MRATRSPISPIRSKSAYSFACLLATAFLALIAGSAQALPADRGYEMVSPVDKNSGDVGAGGFTGKFRASEDGKHIAYTGVGGWGDTPANTVVTSYMADRGAAGWGEESLMLPIFPVGVLANWGPVAISKDFSRVVVNTNLDLATGEEQDITQAINGLHYLVDVATGETTLLSRPAVDGQTYPAPRIGEYMGSDDFSVIYFHTFGAPLTDDSVSVSGSKLYRIADGELTLASIAPDGQPMTGGLQLPAPAAGNRRWAAMRPSSPDGSVYFFDSSGRIYRRDVDASETVLVNVSENTVEPVQPSTALFSGASEDGSVAYFLSSQKLVDQDTDTLEDLYRWDEDAPDGSKLTLISIDSEGSDAQAAADASYTISRDGSRIYFASPSQLVSGEPTAAGSKIYVWDAEGGLRYIANVGTRKLVTDVFGSENGAYLGMRTNAALTSDDNGGLNQAYVYDYQQDQVHCASCPPGGGPATAQAFWRDDGPGLGFFDNGRTPLRNVSDNGHVFFDTTGDLLPQDTNGKFDVYVWQDSQLDLLSTGRSSDRSRFTDADASGEKAFFYTREQLVGWDVDDGLDIYLAGVGAGLPEPEPMAPPCVGDDCQPPTSQQPGGQTPGSSSYLGSGNPSSSDLPHRDCRKLERKSKKLAKRAKRLKGEAQKASGKRAKRISKRLSKTRKKARKARNRAAGCNRRAAS